MRGECLGVVMLGKVVEIVYEGVAMICVDCIVSFSAPS